VATPVTMPQLGETVVEGTITKWLKKEGEQIDRDEPLFEISTDKVDTEVPSPVAGTLVEIKVPEGETVQVGTELAMIETDGQAASGQPKRKEAGEEEPEPGAQEVAPKAGAAPAPKAEEEPEEAEQAEEEAEAEEREKEKARPDEERRRAEPAREEPSRGPAEETEARGPARGAVEAQARGAVEAAPGGGARSQILSPLVRRLAEENQIDLSRVSGTGTGGRITKKDVMAYVETGGAEARPAAAAPRLEAVPQPTPAREAAPAPRAAGEAREEAIPLTRMRQAIARNMVASIQTTARAWNLVEVNMENVVRTREGAKEAFRQREGINLTFMPFVARAVCEALLAFPDVNSELREDQLIRKHYVNLGIAVALEEGLIVPVVKGADTMNIIGLARAINDIATRARSKKLVPDDVQGGTFTITNPGPFGSIISVPVINPPQCAILAFDAVERRPVVEGDAIAIRHMVYISMSWDHRIIDGATAAQFLGRVKQNLETWDFGPEVGLPARGS
jgi:pyruvate dehydrogenase E2 component (dihydrolipoyllysine-residue acetyltransferase)